MHNDNVSRQAANPSQTFQLAGEYRPHAREERGSVVLALIALAFSLAVAMTLVLMPLPAAAAPAAPSLELAAFKVVPASPAHAERLVPATETRAGDRLEYVATYRNPTDAAVRHVLVTVPVPRNGVEYLLESAAPHADLASTDGKQFAALPLERVRTAADGRKVTTAAPAADYRFLRWDLGDVPAGATRTVRARVQVSPTTATAD